MPPQGIHKIGGKAWLRCISSVLKLMVMVRFRCVTSQKMLEQFTNHTTLVQPTNQSTLCFSGGGASYRQELNRALLREWKERCCNNVKFVKSMRKECFFLTFRHGLRPQKLLHYTESWHIHERSSKKVLKKLSYFVASKSLRSEGESQITCVFMKQRSRPLTDTSNAFKNSTRVQITIFIHLL